jgi:hypothetical protein
MHPSPSTPQALSDYQDSHSISWDLSSYSVSSGEDDEHSGYFHLIGDHILGAHETEQSILNRRINAYSEHRQEDKCNFLFCSSAADQLLRKIFPFFFKPPAISKVEEESCCKETVRHVHSSSPTSVVVQKSKLWAEFFTDYVNHPKCLDSPYRQGDRSHQCGET